MDVYIDADDRLLAEIDEDAELAYIEGDILINEDIQLPLFVYNGIPYYE